MGRACRSRTRPCFRENIPLFDEQSNAARGGRRVGHRELKKASGNPRRSTGQCAAKTLAPFDDKRTAPRSRKRGKPHDAEAHLKRCMISTKLVSRPAKWHAGCRRGHWPAAAAQDRDRLRRIRSSPRTKGTAILFRWPVGRLSRNSAPCQGVPGSEVRMITSGKAERRSNAARPPAPNSKIQQHTRPIVVSSSPSPSTGQAKQARAIVNTDHGLGSALAGHDAARRNIDYLTSADIEAELYARLHWPR